MSVNDNSRLVSVMLSLFFFCSVLYSILKLTDEFVLYKSAIYNAHVVSDDLDWFSFGTLTRYETALTCRISCISSCLCTERNWKVTDFLRYKTVILQQLFFANFQLYSHWLKVILKVCISSGWYCCEESKALVGEDYQEDTTSEVHKGGLQLAFND